MKFRSALERFLDTYAFPLYAGLFLSALFLRLAVLESGPLSGGEAAQAWGALALLRGGAASSSSALFASLTAGLLFLTGPSHWAPRLFPAAAGALAVLLPLTLRNERGKIETFLMALFLALSPSLWIGSTTAGGTSIGFLAAVFCIFYLRSREPRPLVSGLALGLAAASGPVGWSGLILAAAVPIVDRILRPEALPAGAGRRSFLTSPLALAGFAAGLTAGSTGLFFFPRGLGALAGGFSEWLGAFFSGWPRAGELILLFLGYEPIALVFGLAGFILLRRGLLDAQDRFWGIFAAASAVWVLIRPAAFPDEALWVVLPFLVLGVSGLRKALESPVLEERPLYIFGQGAAALALAAFSLFNLAAFVSSRSWLYLLMAAVGFLAGWLPGLLIAEELRKAVNASLVGLAAAYFIFFAAAQTGAGWNATHARRNSANELWYGETAAADLLRLHRTLVQISEWRTGVKDELTVVIQLPEQSALGWELLTYQAAGYAISLDTFSTPPVVVTPYVEVEGTALAPQLAAVYRGQAFGYTERRAWSGWPPDLIGWLLYREGPVERSRLIIWVREDILVPEEGAEQ